MRILDHLDMFPLDYETAAEDMIALGPPSTILCSKGFWVQHDSVYKKKDINDLSLDLYKDGWCVGSLSRSKHDI